MRKVTALTLRGLLALMMISASLTLISAYATSSIFEVWPSGDLSGETDWSNIMDAFAQHRAASVHREEIKELSESFVAEAAPMVVQVQGETMRLTGTAEAQYESWRKLLRDIYQTETGFPENVQVSDPARSQQPPG